MVNCCRFGATLGLMVRRPCFGLFRLLALLSRVTWARSRRVEPLLVRGDGTLERVRAGVGGQRVELHPADALEVVPVRALGDVPRLGHTVLDDLRPVVDQVATSTERLPG